MGALLGVWTWRSINEGVHGPPRTGELLESSLATLRRLERGLTDGQIALDEYLLGWSALYASHFRVPSISSLATAASGRQSRELANIQVEAR